MAVSKNPKITDQDTAIAQIYDTLVRDLGQGQQYTKDIFAQGAKDIGAAYTGASSELSKGQAGMASRMSQQLGGLGLQAALPQAMAGSQEGYSRIMGDIARDRGSNLGGLATQGTQYQAIGQLGIGNAHKEKAQTRVSAMERLQAVLAELEGERLKAKAELEMQMLQIREAMAARRDAAREAAANRAEARRASGGDSDPLLALKAQAMGLENQLLEKELMGGGEAQEYQSGQRGLSQFLNSPSAWWGKKGADSATVARINNILRTTPQRLASTGNWKSGGKSYNSKNLSPLDIAMIGVGNTKERRINKDALRMAMELMYGGYAK